jgi:tetratricopeptide (TPR) repeat protein
VDIELRLAQGERALRRVIDRLDAEGEGPDLSVARVSLTLAHVVAERGHVDEGLALLDELAADPGHGLGGLVLSQRGLLHLRSGRFDLALADLDAAVAGWHDQDLGLVRLLLNRSMLHLRAGRLAAAREDLERCVGIATELGLPVHAARARHNLGYLQWLAGDLPAALAEMDAAQAQQADAGPGSDAVYRLDRARVLFSAGLLDEADADLAAAVESFAAVGSRQDRAECELSRAQIALTLGRPDDALALTRRARREFDRRGSRSWALLARLVEVRSLVSTGRPGAVTVSEIDALASALSSAGLHDDARIARLVGVRARLLQGNAAQAAEALPRLRHGEPITVRLYARELRADVARASGQAARASAELRAGLEELHRHQASFGSLDLQTAVTRHARALAANGLAAAIEDGRAAAVFTWAERARALASRIPPVRPPRDDEAARLLAQLRFVRTELRQRELAGEDDPALRASRTDLERMIRQRSWYASGPGSVERPASLDSVRGALAGTADGQSAYVAHLAVDGGLAALCVTSRAVRLVRLGDTAAALEQVRRVRADLDALALRGVPQSVRGSITRSLRASLAQLCDQLWTPLAPLVRDDAVVLVPSGGFVALPWTLLPPLRGRAVTVGRSATSWLRAQATPWPARRPDGVLLAAGPDLPHAEAEVVSAATLWPGAQVLTGARAGADAVLAGLGTHWLVHVAAHGVHEAANPLFSSLNLADGPLFGHDLDTVPALPHHVVLSACDLGRVTQRAGDEVLGLTAALLHGGTVCVLSSVARVADDVAAEVLVHYHRQLQAGASPAQALAVAAAGQDAAPFVCFGAAT